MNFYTEDDLAQVLDWDDDTTTTEVSTGFVIDNDEKANWAIQKILNARATRDRRISLARKEIVKRENDIAEADERCRKTEERYMGALGVYFDSTDPKLRSKGKTQEKYELLDGSIVKKYSKITFKVKEGKEEEFLKYLKENAPECVKTVEKPKWGEFKKQLADAGGNVVNSETGEFLDGFIEIETVPDTYEVKI